MTNEDRRYFGLLPKISDAVRHKIVREEDHIHAATLKVPASCADRLREEVWRWERRWGWKNSNRHDEYRPDKMIVAESSVLITDGSRGMQWSTNLSEVYSALWQSTVDGSPIICSSATASR